jgi:hypothetical protein
VGVFIEELQSNRAGVTVAKFWQGVLGNHACKDRVQRTVVRDGTIVRLSAPDTTEGRQMVATLASRLKRVSPRQFCEGRCAHLAGTERGGPATPAPSRVPAGIDGDRVER